MELTLGRAIRARREALDLTQEELAERVAALGDEAIRQSDISRIERGQVQLPRLARIEMIAQALEVELGELLIAAGWLTVDPARTAVDKQADPESDPLDAEGETQHYSQALAAYDQSIRNAYDQIAEDPEHEAGHHELFERRKARFEEMVRRFEEARKEFERARPE